MQNQKFDNMLNLALEISREYYQAGSPVWAGYDYDESRWELVVKYHGSLDILSEQGILVEKLLAGYAIITLPENMIDYVGDLEQIEYVEKPKYYYTQQLLPGEGINASAVKRRFPNLSGKGVLIGILDSGLYYKRKDFLDREGNTRLVAYYDQSGVKKIYDMEEINTAIKEGGEGPSEDTTGHGTAVCGIAAASATYEDGKLIYEGVAQEAGIVFVKMGKIRERSFARTTDIMRGVTFCLKVAQEMNRPLVINLSYGSSDGPHDGSSLLERFLDNAGEVGKTIICVGSGNEGAFGGHYRGIIKNGQQQRISFSVGDYETSLDLQLWKNFGDEMQIVLENPTGEVITIDKATFEKGGSIIWGQNRIVAYYGEALPYRVTQEIFVEIENETAYVQSGIWHIILTGKKIQNGIFDVYLENSAVRSKDTRFLTPDAYMTITSPGNARKVVTVGAFDTQIDAYADFSGRGEGLRCDEPPFMSGVSKPNLSAPGVDILAPFQRTGYQGVTGTSFATPLVSGMAALLMEWGIVRGNDPYLYAEKLKAMLQKNTILLKNMRCRPDEKVGYGGVTFENVFK